MFILKRGFVGSNGSDFLVSANTPESFECRQLVKKLISFNLLLRLGRPRISSLPHCLGNKVKATASDKTNIKKIPKEYQCKEKARQNCLKLHSAELNSVLK